MVNGNIKKNMTRYIIGINLFLYFLILFTTAFAALSATASITIEKTPASYNKEASYINFFFSEILKPLIFTFL